MSIERGISTTPRLGKLPHIFANLTRYALSLSLSACVYVAPPTSHRPCQNAIMIMLLIWERLWDEKANPNSRSLAKVERLLQQYSTLSCLPFIIHLSWACAYFDSSLLPTTDPLLFGRLGDWPHIKGTTHGPFALPWLQYPFLSHPLLLLH